MANSAEHLEVMFVAAAMGAVFHPVNHNLSAGHVVDVLTDARDRVVVCDATLLDSVVPLLPGARRYGPSSSSDGTPTAPARRPSPAPTAR